MNKISGMMLSEVMTYLIVMIVVIAVGIGIYVNAEIDKKLETAEAVITAVKDRVTEVEAAGEKVACDNSMIDQQLLINDFVTVTIVPAEVTQFDPSKGYGVGVKLVSEPKSTNKDSFTIASRLYESLREEDKYALREVEIDEENVHIMTLISKSAICTDIASQIASDAPPTESEQPTEMTTEGTTSS